MQLTNPIHSPRSNGLYLDDGVRKEAIDKSAAPQTPRSLVFEPRQGGSMIVSSLRRKRGQIRVVFAEASASFLSLEEYF